MVNVAPLLAAPLAVKIHVLTVLPAFVLGLWLLAASRKGSRWHRRLGRVYLVLMTVTSVAAVFVRSFSAWSVTLGPLKLGLIHLFVPLTLHGVYGAIATIRRGDIAGHRGAMKGVFFGGLIVAGLLAFAPGRIMYRMFFG